jgi:trehalose 6-phosphate phosphatase
LARFGYRHGWNARRRRHAILRRTRNGQLPPASAFGSTRRVSRPPPLDRDSALFIDVDGTLLEIAPRPELVSVPAGLPALLERLAQQRDGALALISGRKLADLDRLLQPWRGAAAGVHGAERRRAAGSPVESEAADADRAASAALNRLRPQLTQIAGASPGAWLEDKGHTLALHYRAIPQKEGEIGGAVRRLAQHESEALRLIAGKMVMELQPRHRNKGTVISAFLAEPPFDGRHPLFIGDDVTDEDGFAEVNRRGGLSIAVGVPPAQSAAVYRLPSVAEVLNWLAAAGET